MTTQHRSLEPSGTRAGPTATGARKALAGVALLALLVGCATLAQPTSEDASWAAERWPGTTQAALARGRALYVGHCAGCHALYRPERYPPSTWQTHLDEMSERSKLQASERDLVLRYLLTMGRPPAAGPSTKTAPKPPELASRATGSIDNDHRP